MASRLRRICSTAGFFNTRSGALTTHLMKRGYKHRLVKDAVEKVLQISRSRAPETSTKKESDIIPFEITLNPEVPNISQVISSNLNILRSFRRCLKAFSSPARLSYRRCKTLQDILVRAKHGRKAPPHPRASGAFRCHRDGTRRFLSLQS